jgi:hypothetical protein
LARKFLGWFLLVLLRGLLDFILVVAFVELDKALVVFELSF